VTNGVAPLTVHFGADITGSFNQTAWTFDNGEFSFAQQPTNIFRTPGIYTAHLTVTATNGNTAMSSVVVTVNSTFDLWRAAKFSASELTNNAVSGAAANPDGDTLPNLLEYALGLDPKAADAGIPFCTLSNGNFYLSVPHLKAATDVSLTVESSTDLQNWAAVDPSQFIDDGPLETIVVSEALVGNTHKFFRLRAVHLP
jgi:PKD repeat protein